MIVTLIRCSVCSAFYLGFRRAAIWVFGLFSKAKDLEPVIGFGDNILAKTKYNEEFTSAIVKNNIYGVQFHPEKSHLAGINLLKNFSNL